MTATAYVPVLDKDFEKVSRLEEATVEPDQMARELSEELDRSGNAETESLEA